MGENDPFSVSKRYAELINFVSAIHFQYNHGRNSVSGCGKWNKGRLMGYDKRSAGKLAPIFMVVAVTYTKQAALVRIMK